MLLCLCFQVCSLQNIQTNICTPAEFDSNVAHLSAALQVLRVQ
jgi:hypothetical protein